MNGMTETVTIRLNRYHDLLKAKEELKNLKNDLFSWDRERNVGLVDKQLALILAEQQRGAFMVSLEDIEFK
ncbi:hypothetical protein [Paenilisteria newyorkensis]|uniref:hypothetical protein n=1 Tax=Listeria newyorkensis TaxID=1497681 RepID=UPI002359C6A9|nr:hypothetical protein [Listeria newyorkensis]WAO22043.1 hypothetical protein OTR81_01750 [Listeria newyorkensis]